MVPLCLNGIEWSRSDRLTRSVPTPEGEVPRQRGYMCRALRFTTGASVVGLACE